MLTRLAGLALLIGSAFFLTAQPSLAGTFNQIRFTIQTGNDDIRKDSSAIATLKTTNGKSQVFTLKGHNKGSWGNYSTNTVTFGLNPPLDPAQITQIIITLQQHKSTFQSDDNWNIESVRISLLNTGTRLRGIRDELLWSALGAAHRQSGQLRLANPADPALSQIQSD